MEIETEELFLYSSTDVEVPVFMIIFLLLVFIIILNFENSSFS